jgi:hypothetical protein
MNEKERRALSSALEQDQRRALREAWLSQPGGKIGDRISQENCSERQPASELFFDSRHELDRKQRVTSELEEAIADTDRSYAKKLLEETQ